jgi:crossover junction endodeoxyribonuclease RuvC
MAAKVLSVYKGVVEVIAQFQPEAMAVEELYAHYDHPRTAILMGHARGVIFLAAAQQGIPVVSYASTQVKKLVTGNGRASKDQVQRAIQGELGLAALPDPPDVADALAVALCHYYQNKLEAQG